jgi:hypothetical protein
MEKKEIRTAICILTSHDINPDINYPELIKEGMQKIISHFGTKWAKEAEEDMPMVLVDCNVTEEDITFLESIMPSTGCRLLCLQAEKDNVKSTGFMLQVL